MNKRYQKNISVTEDVDLPSSVLYELVLQVKVVLKNYRNGTGKRTRLVKCLLHRREDSCSVPQIPEAMEHVCNMHTANVTGGCPAFYWSHSLDG